jgi:hypothetical protein
MIDQPITATPASAQGDGADRPYAGTRRPIGSSTADDPNQPAGDDQIIGRIHACLDYLLAAADRHDARNVRAWVSEIRGLLDVLEKSAPDVRLDGYVRPMGAR